MPARPIEPIGRSELAAAEPQLPFISISSASPREEIGKDIKYFGFSRDGNQYWLKDDCRGLQVRASEMFCYGVSRALGYAVPDYGVAQYAGDTYFASRDDLSSGRDLITERRLSERRLSAEGMPNPEPGRYLAKTYALDMLLGNPDRQLRNFIAGRDGMSEVLYLIDFGDVLLKALGTGRFPAFTSHTRLLWRRLRAIHEPSLEIVVGAAVHFRSLSAGQVCSILQGIPDEWLPASQKELIHQVWTSGQMDRHISSFVSGVEDGTLV
jgi:hypothetical protein